MQVRNPPAIVRQAIANYVPPPGFRLVAPSTNESSFIWMWGVRVKCFVDQQGGILEDVLEGEDSVFVLLLFLFSFSFGVVLF